MDAPKETLTELITSVAWVSDNKSFNISRITEKHINDFLKKYHKSITVKMFRTWNANYMLLKELMHFKTPKDEKESKKNINIAISKAAKHLHHTKAVSKNSYMNNEMIDLYIQNPKSFYSLIQRGYNQKRSGDVVVSLQTGWISSYWSTGGTTHGSSYSYDTHVPLVFWGGNIPQGKTDRKVNIRDIAPTISTILGTAYPNGCTGNPLPEVTE